MASDTVGAAEEQQRASLLIVGQRVLLAAREPVKRRVGEDQREFELSDRLREHVVGDRASCLHLGKDLAEELAILRHVVDPPDDLSADVEVVSGKNEARRLYPLGRRNKRLRNQQVCLVRKRQALGWREHEPEAIVERVERQRGEARIPH